jgi:hypothetical protein
MKKKIAIFLIVNVLLTYVLLVCLGWIAYFICGGNPTYFVPLPALFLIFLIIQALINRGLLKKFKIYTLNLFLVSIVEAGIIYALLFRMYH